MSDTGYNGWANYETWCVALWINNDPGDQEYWHERARECVRDTADKAPNEYMGHEDNARYVLCDVLKARHDEIAEEWMGSQAGVFADLMNAALSEVNWHEIAGSLIDASGAMSDTESDD